LWVVDVFPFTLVLPTWYWCCLIELFAPIFMVLVVLLCHKGMFGPSFLGVWNGCVAFPDLVVMEHAQVLHLDLRK
jgi:hypothetical protein